MFPISGGKCHIVSSAGGNCHDSWEPGWVPKNASILQAPEEMIGVSRQIARNITCFLFNGKEKLHFGQYLSWNLHVYCIYATSCVFNLINFTVVPKMNREL